jgi:hypothetical protein
VLPKSGLACLFLLSSLSFAQAAHSQAATDGSAAKVTSLETKFFAHPYKAEGLSRRVSRLEKFVYGTESNETLESRIRKLTESTVVIPSSATVEHVTQRDNAAAAAGKQTSTRHDVLDQTRYPRVSELEQEIFDKTFESDAIPTRIARLEDKVFGRVWATQTDLAVRVDRLGEYAFMSPKVEELERAELQRVSYLQNVAYQQPQPVKRFVVHTVVDEIESMETLTYGKISASKPIAQRVDALEVTLLGATQSGKQQNITSRVALLFSRFNNAAPGQIRSGV